MKSYSVTKSDCNNTMNSKIYVHLELIDIGVLYIMSNHVSSTAINTKDVLVDYTSM